MDVFVLFSLIFWGYSSSWQGRHSGKGENYNSLTFLFSVWRQTISMVWNCLTRLVWPVKLSLCGGGIRNMFHHIQLSKVGFGIRLLSPHLHGKHLINTAIFPEVGRVYVYHFSSYLLLPFKFYVTLVSHENSNSELNLSTCTGKVLHAYFLFCHRVVKQCVYTRV